MSKYQFIKRTAPAALLAAALVATPAHADNDADREDRARAATNVVQVVLLVMTARWLWRQWRK